MLLPKHTVSQLNHTDIFGCAVSPPPQVHETNEMLNTWMQHVDELRNQYNWLLFFSMPKLLLLYNLLQVATPNLEAIVHEISFLCVTEKASWKSTREMVEVRVESGRRRRKKRGKWRNNVRVT